MSEFEPSDSGDDTSIPMGATIGLKIERTVMAFLYCVMLTVACSNVWNYLIKKGLYKSYPLTMAYFILLIYSLISICYELYMSIGCGDHDCIAVLPAMQNAEDDDQNRDKYRRIVGVITNFWAVRQQLQWSMGLLQAITVLVLYLRISQIQRTSNRVQDRLQNSPSQAQEDFTQCKVIIAYSLTSLLLLAVFIALVLITATHIYDLSTTYNVVLIVQETCSILIMITAVVLLFRQLNAISDVRNAFKSEKRAVLLTMIFFCLSDTIRIIMASLQLSDVNPISSLRQIPAVQFEILTTILNDQLPFYFFMCQHIHNISDTSQDNEEDASAAVNKLGGPQLFNRRTLHLGATSSQASLESILRLGYVHTDAISCDFNNTDEDGPSNDMNLRIDADATSAFGFGLANHSTNPLNKSKTRSMNTSSLELNNQSSYEPLETTLLGQKDDLRRTRNSSHVADSSFRNTCLTFADIDMVQRRITRRAGVSKTFDSNQQEVIDREQQSSEEEQSEEEKEPRFSVIQEVRGESTNVDSRPSEYGYIKRCTPSDSTGRRFDTMSTECAVFVKPNFRVQEDSLASSAESGEESGGEPIQSVQNSTKVETNFRSSRSRQDISTGQERL